MRPLSLSAARAGSSVSNVRELTTMSRTDPPAHRCRSYAEMDGVAKNKISHRYRALEKLRKFLLEQME